MIKEPKKVQMIIEDLGKNDIQDPALPCRELP